MKKAIIINKNFSANYDKKHYLDKDIFIDFTNLENLLDRSLKLTNLDFNLIIFNNNRKLINNLYAKIVKNNIKISSIIYNFDYSNLEMITYLNSKFIYIENKKYFFDNFELYKCYISEKNIFSEEVLTLQYLISQYQQIYLNNSLNIFYKQKNNISYEVISKNYIYLLSIIENIKKKKELIVQSKEEYQINQWKKLNNFIQNLNKFLNLKFL